MPFLGASVPGWILAGLCFGMSALAETDPEFSQCRQSFYKRTPPVGVSGGHLLHRCHSLDGGQTFATLYCSTCDVTVFSAFCLDYGWEERGTVGESQQAISQDDGAVTDTEDAQTKTAENDESQNDDIPVTPPGLLRRENGTSDTLSNSWDAMVSELVRNLIHPRCYLFGGDLYVLTGAGVVGEFGEGCAVGPFWSAMCCAIPNQDTGFSFGVVKVKEEGVRVLEVKGLEEMVGVTGIFSGGCGEVDGGGEGTGVSVLALIQNEVHQIVETHSTDTQPDPADALTQSSVSDGTATPSTDTQPDSADVLTQSSVSDSTATPSTDTQPDSADALAQSSQAETTATRADAQSAETDGGSESVDIKSRCDVLPNADEEPSARISQVADERHAEPRGNSTLLYLLSCSVSLLTTPLRPVVSSLTQIPGQVSHVIQEHLTVLSSLPGDTLSLFYNVIADVGWGVMSAGGLAGRAGALCASQLYSCTSPLVGTLIDTCKHGVTGAGTLTWDGVGIFGGMVDRTWSVSRFVGGRVWEQSKGYLWTVLCEFGSQTQRVGGGLGKLVVRGAKGVGNVVYMTGRVVGGGVGLVVETAREVFGKN